MKLIVAVDKNWGIGHKGKLLVRIPSDLKRFRKLTLGKVVVLGRKTLETFPQKQPLDNRVNIILTGDKDYKVKNAVVVNSIDELNNELKKYNSDDIFIIGGQSVYEQMLDYCDEAFVTYLDYAYDSDVYFPNLDQNEKWQLMETGEEQTFFDVIFRYKRYEKKQEI